MAKKVKEGEETALVDDREVRVYELGFHLDPDLPTEGVKTAYQAVRDLIAKGGAVVAEGEPLTVQLAYPISRQETSGRRDFTSAYFSWIAYEMTPEAHEGFVSQVGQDKHIIRFIDLITTKEAARHAVEIREFTTKSPEPSEETPEEVADVELDAALQNVTL